MRLSMRMCIQVPCGTCGQLRDEDEARDFTIQTALFGAEPFVHCPGCYQEVPKELWTETYKILWRVRWAKIAERVREKRDAAQR